MRRAFIVAAVFILIVGVGVIVYFSFFQSSPAVTVTSTATGNGLPVAGQGPVPSGTGSDQTPSSTTAQNVSPVSVSARLVKISAGPIVPGETVVDQTPLSASSSPDALASFIERQSGNVFTYSLRTRTITRTSNRTVPGIELASWLPNGSTAFVRYLSGNDFSTVNTYALPASGSNGFFLPQNLSDIAVSSTSVLTLASGVNGSTASLSRIDGSHATTVFSTPLTSLHISFLGKSQYLAVTKAASSISGSAFVVDASGHFTRIAGPLPGLTALPSPSGKWVFVSYASGDTLSSELVNVATGETLPLPLSTIAEKCVWASDESAIYCGVPNGTPNGTYPDDWYQGILHFSDRIWKIQVAGRYAQLLIDVSQEANSAIDITAPSIDRSGTFLVFVNKNDGSLWGYAL